MALSVTPLQASKVPTYLHSIIDAVGERLPEMRSITGPPTEPTVMIDGKPIIMCCSPNYLGLANHPRVCAGAIEAIAAYGAGTVGSAIVSGYIEPCRLLEEELARFMGEESALVYNSVSDANRGVIASVVCPPALPLLHDHLATGFPRSKAVFFDKQNHASLWSAIRGLDVDKTYYYDHLDMNDLERRLKQSDHELKLIVTDGYFSMSARLAPLPDIISLAEQHGAVIFVDDAHGTGVLGATGRGTAEQFGVEDAIHFLVASLAKSFGVRGGYIAGEARLMAYLKMNSSSYMFSGTLPPAIPGALSVALRLAREEPWRRQRLLSNADYLRTGLKNLGYRVLGEAHIVPWFIGDEAKAIAVAHDLYDRSILAPCIRFPAIQRGHEIVRFIPMATHNQQHLDSILRACDHIGTRLGVCRE